MKKLVLSTATVGLLAVYLLFSCKKDVNPSFTATKNIDATSVQSNARQSGDFIEIEELDPGVTFMKSLPRISSFLNSNQIEHFNKRVKKDIENSNWTVYDLQSERIGDKQYNIICVTNSNKKIVFPYLFESSFQNNDIISVTTKGIVSNEILATVTKDPVTGTINRPTCLETTDNFNDCFKCAWDEVQDDFLGTVACTLNPWSCLIAAAFACGVIDNGVVHPEHSARYVTSQKEIEDLINTGIKAKNFTTFEKVGNVYIVN